MCNVLDDESHRINDCKKRDGINVANSREKIMFGDIYLDDYERCLKVVERVLLMWDLENGKNEMRSSIV